MPIGSLPFFRDFFAVEELPDATSHDMEEGFEAQVAKLWRTVSDKKKQFQKESFNLFWRRKKKPEWGPAGAFGFGCGVGVGVGLTGGMGIAAKPWEQFRLVVGVGAGCGVGIGYGYGFGIGLRWDEPPRWIRKNLVFEL